MKDAMDELDDLLSSSRTLSRNRMDSFKPNVDFNIPDINIHTAQTQWNQWNWRQTPSPTAPPASDATETPPQFDMINMSASSTPPQKQEEEPRLVVRQHFVQKSYDAFRTITSQYGKQGPRNPYEMEAEAYQQEIQQQQQQEKKPQEEETPVVEPKVEQPEVYMRDEEALMIKQVVEEPSFTTSIEEDAHIKVIPLSFVEAFDVHRQPIALNGVYNAKLQLNLNNNHLVLSILYDDMKKGAMALPIHLERIVSILPHPHTLLEIQLMKPIRFAQRQETHQAIMDHPFEEAFRLTLSIIDTATRDVVFGLCASVPRLSLIPKHRLLINSMMAVTSHQDVLTSNTWEERLFSITSFEKRAQVMVKHVCGVQEADSTEALLKAIESFTLDDLDGTTETHDHASEVHNQKTIVDVHTKDHQLLMTSHIQQIIPTLRHLIVSKVASDELSLFQINPDLCHVLRPELINSQERLTRAVLILLSLIDHPQYVYTDKVAMERFIIFERSLAIKEDGTQVRYHSPYDEVDEQPELVEKKDTKPSEKKNSLVARLFQKIVPCIPTS